MPAEHQRRGDAQAALRLAAAAVQLRLGRLQLGQRAHAAVVIGLAVVGQALLARGAVEQPHAQPGLQPRDGLADGRACQAQALGRQREAAGLGRLHEGFDAVEPVVDIAGIHGNP